MGIGGTYINITKAIYDKPASNIILNAEKLKASPLRSVSTFTTIIQHCFGSPSYSIQRRKEIKGIRIREEEVTLSLFADDMILY